MNKDHEFQLTIARYQALTDLWRYYHRLLVVYPIVLMIAACAILHFLPLPALTRLYDSYDQYRWSGELALAIGLPLTVLGFALLAYVYVMYRARTVIRGVESEITKIEGDMAGLERHPVGIHSSLVSLVMMIALSVTILVVGLFVAMGLVGGVVLLLLIFGVLMMRGRQTELEALQRKVQSDSTGQKQPQPDKMSEPGATATE